MAHIRLNNVSLSYPIYQGSSRSLKKTVALSTKFGRMVNNGGNLIEIQALKSLNLDIEEGSRIGLIGHNGAGKTTLLKVLGGIYEPTDGHIDINGDMSLVLDSSAGMNDDATGLENIKLRSLYMGLSAVELNRQFDEIAEFTELGDFLEMPVRTYSAGMRLRLAFAISTCMQPEILLMDEWLGAGDRFFLEKARKKMQEFVGNSSILVFASHSRNLLQQWCDQAIFLDQGKLKAFGPIQEVFEIYESTASGASGNSAASST
tara:strand:- start:2025 stop:2807 length:783 start_codon:yes stop_codon:yes gene_type:complete